MDAPAETPQNLAPPSQPAPAPSKPKASKRPFIIAGVAVVAIAGAAYYMYSRQFEDTDDAQIDGTITNLSARVPGNVKAVYVTDNQVVKAGDKLLDLDPADLEVVVAQAKAALALAEAQLVAEDPSVAITEASNTSAMTTAASELETARANVSSAAMDVKQISAQLELAQANDKNAQVEKERAERLFAQGAISATDRDARVTQAVASAANANAAKQALAAARDRLAAQNARIGAAKAKLGEVESNAPLQVETRKANVSVRRANLDVARAEVKQATLNLSYASLVAPADGIVGKKSVSVGEHVAPGQQLLALSQIERLWVTANFRENQLRRMQPGQDVEVHVDALDVDLKGKVESIGGATGARFSVLPPENAAGNYVKVVQRIPVRIALAVDEATAKLLRPGMSVEPKVRVR
ncbi:MAG TPA: HlyD family secretion protein [Byssovorax sp.]|jgi:membrane fusion protein (multidrug efflux system)